MNNGKYVFSQLLDFLDRNHFNYLVRKNDGDKYVKQFTCYNQLATLMFGQLSGRESLRDVVLATQAHASKATHLGFGKFVTRSNLSKANNNRDYRIFEEFAYQVVAEARKCRATDIFKLGGNVYAFDSTTIELCLERFKWAIFRKNQRKGGIKVHTLYDLETSIPTFFHITEARVNDMNAMDVIPYEENSFYIFDRGYNDFERLYRINVIVAYFVVRGKYPERIRRITYWDEEEQRKFIFFTNALDISPMMVDELYHNRWQIELFFKWLKQHLKIKKFWGESENAERIQIYSAITAYCMMAIVQKKMGIDRPIYEMLQLVSVSLTDKTTLDRLFGKPNYNIVNELDGSSEPTLF